MVETMDCPQCGKHSIRCSLVGNRNASHPGDDYWEFRHYCIGCDYADSFVNQVGQNQDDRWAFVCPSCGYDHLGCPDGCSHGS
jgi:predicted RNA-binding Zn-ribbon protein involved in translation (DUF1610 family)